MKKRQFERLCKTLLPDLPGFVCRGWYMPWQEITYFVKGFCCDPSGFDRTEFTVWAFVVPLYVPTETLHLTFGFRLADERGCGIWWNISDPEVREKLLAKIREQGLPYLMPINTPRDFIIALERRGMYDSYNPHVREAIAYSYILDGDARAADDALETWPEKLNTSIQWQQEILERVRLIRAKLGEGLEHAREQLLEWEKLNKQKHELWWD